MAMQRNRIVLIVLVVAVAASLWRTLSLESQKRRITTAYDQAQQTLAELQAERAQLNAELGSAKETIQGQSEDLSGLQTQLQQTLLHSHDPFQGGHRAEQLLEEGRLAGAQPTRDQDRHPGPDKRFELGHQPLREEFTSCQAVEANLSHSEAANGQARM